MNTIYTLANCDSCRTATKWLRARKIPFEERAIRETPPTPEHLRTMLAAVDGDMRRLFNTSGRVYRERKLADKLPTLTPAAAVEVLAADGDLVKRPFLVGDGVALVGFSESVWASAFPQR